MKNLLCPEDIEWKLQMSMALSNEHRMLYRNDQYGFQMEIYTKKKNEFEFGKPKTYYFRDESEKEYNDLQILCDDWNEIKNYDDENTEIEWVKVFKQKK
ncbi:hypothetical protein [Epilithonimonas sp.]|uniref:hypothetical protein n=1 Tax=Epilithonimonas sp. TaxID=2894511 RepID=UPI0028B10A50|nr:hypothetical protein [Epilithonimonas sp.]